MKIYIYYTTVYICVYATVNRIIAGQALLATYNTQRIWYDREAKLG